MSVTDETTLHADEEGADISLPSQDEIEEAAAAADAEGRSIEDRAAEGEDDDPEKPTPPMQLPLQGTRDTIPQSWGGAKATSSEMRLMGGKQPIEGAFDKGEIVTLIVEAKVFHVGGVDFTDDWGTVTKTVRRHHARIISCSRQESPDA